MKEKRKEYVVKIGPELMEIINKQIEKIQIATYGVEKGSIWVAGEILAKKINGEV